MGIINIQKFKIVIKEPSMIIKIPKLNQTLRRPVYKYTKV